MKKYKSDIKNNLFISKGYYFYKIKSKNHGFYYTYITISQKNYSKGYYNMGNQYSHWRESRKGFYYFI